MTEKEMKQLDNLLYKLRQNVAPCQGGVCLGKLTCDFCTEETRCTIDDIMHTMWAEWHSQR